MPTVNYFPEEVLLMILEKLNVCELREAQKVCRAWYFPGHISFLKEIRLCSARNIHQFITSIDHNPNSNYLKAVKCINIGIGEEEEEDRSMQFDKEKLFLRFPNLEDVFVHGYYTLSFQEFNDQVCKEFLKHCPNLQSFEFMPNIEDAVRAYKLLYAVRLLLTSIHLDKLILLVTPDKCLTEYIAEFPRVQTLEDESGVLFKFQDVLPIFDQLNYVATFNITSTGDDQKDFAERYLETKTKQQQDLIIERLSKVKDLRWDYMYNDLCTNSAKFLDKYLTGLDRFTISSNSIQVWKTSQQRIFCKNVLRLLCSAKRYSYFRFNMTLQTLSACFPDVVKKLFKKATSKAANRLFTLNLTGSLYDDQLFVRFIMDHSDSNRKITISATGDTCYQYIQRYLLDQATLIKNFDEFVLTIGRGRDEFKTTLSTYHNILSNMPRLKKVTLEVPGSCTEMFERAHKDFIRGANVNSIRSVQKLTLIPINHDAKFQSQLALFSFMFPKLKDLVLVRFCGIWEEGMQEYQVKLPDYSLECLTIDVARIVEVDMNRDYDFFVVDVEFLRDALRYSYKISANLLSVTRIHHGDLQGLTCGDEYFRVHVVVKSLQKLVVCRQDAEGEHSYLGRVGRAIITMKDK